MIFKKSVKNGKLKSRNLSEEKNPPYIFTELSARLAAVDYSAETS